MRELPRGTVTFLFTDIEGSTRLLHELGERYAEALADHRRLLREAFAAHGGVEIDTQGDAFFYAFPDAGEAVAAAAAGRDALTVGPILAELVQQPRRALDVREEERHRSARQLAHAAMIRQKARRD